LEVEEEARPAFLERNCQGDEELRREVESLLAYDKQAQQFIDRPALQLTAEKLADEPPSLGGRRLIHIKFRWRWVPEEWERFIRLEILG